MKKQITQQLSPEQLTKIGILALKLQAQGLTYKEASAQAKKQITLEYESSKNDIDETQKTESSQHDSDEYMATNGLESSQDGSDELSSNDLEPALLTIKSDLLNETIYIATSKSMQHKAPANSLVFTYQEVLGITKQELSDESLKQLCMWKKRFNGSVRVNQE